MSTSLKKFRNVLQDDIAAGGDSAALDQAVLRAIQKFCISVPLWQETITINVVADTADYTLTPTNGETVMCILVEHNDNPIYPVTDIWCNENLGNDWRNDDSATPTKYILSPDRKTITLINTPDTTLASGLVCYTKLKPEWTDITVEDMFFDDHLEAILLGAKEILFGKLEKSWGNEDLADKYRIRFERATGFAKAKFINAQRRSGTIGGRPF